MAEGVTELRVGEVVGRKIGFTNRYIWPNYNVYKPMWGVMTNQTVEYCSIDRATVSLSKLCEPQIESEIVVGLSKALTRNPSIAGIVSCIKWIAPGIEIVDSIYRNWDFALNDTIACGGLHGRLIIGQKLDPQKNLDQSLNNLKVTLPLDGKIIEIGRGAKVMDGPNFALKYLQREIAKNQAEAELKSGDIVTTGTLIDANPIFADQVWTAEFHDLKIIPLEIKFTS